MLASSVAISASSASGSTSTSQPPAASTAALAEEEAQGHRRGALLAPHQVARDLLGDLAGLELDDAGVGLAPGGARAHDGELTAPHRGADVHPARARRDGGVRARDEAAHAAFGIRDHRDRPERPVAPELELDGLAVLRARREEQRAHQGAAERRGRRRRGLVTPRRLADEGAPDEREGAHAASRRRPRARSSSPMEDEVAASLPAHGGSGTLRALDDGAGPSGNPARGAALLARRALARARIVLRLEDLDPERSRPEWSSRDRGRDLAWLGLDFDAVEEQHAARRAPRRRARRASRLRAGSTRARAARRAARSRRDRRPTAPRATRARVAGRALPARGWRASDGAAARAPRSRRDRAPRGERPRPASGSRRASSAIPWCAAATARRPTTSPRSSTTRAPA